MAHRSDSIQAVICEIFEITKESYFSEAVQKFRGGVSSPSGLNMKKVQEVCCVKLLYATSIEDLRAVLWTKSRVGT
jgi:hypothetical protein